MKSFRLLGKVREETIRAVKIVAGKINRLGRKKPSCFKAAKGINKEIKMPFIAK
jgi:hypothetical protein